MTEYNRKASHVAREDLGPISLGVRRLGWCDWRVVIYVDGLQVKTKYYWTRTGALYEGRQMMYDAYHAMLMMDSTTELNCVEIAQENSRDGLDSLQGTL